MSNRREFLKFLAASPLLGALPAGLPTFAQTLAQSGDYIISNPGEALNVFEFEAAARKVLPPAHWGYMASGVDNDESLQANLQGYTHYQVRPRRLVDVSHLDMSTELFGTRWDSPILLCPIGSAKLLNPAGELAVGKAAQAKKALQIVSRRRRIPSKTSQMRGAHRSGFSFIRLTNGTSRRNS
jgi:hypothetical protein